MFVGLFLLCLHVSVAANAVECSDSLVPVTVTREYKENAQEEWMSLWRGEPSSGELLFVESGSGHDQQKVEQTVCVEEGFYSLLLSSFTSTGWSIGSRVIVTLYASYVVLDTTVDSSEEEVYTIDCSWAANPHSSWRYADSYSAGWNSLQFDDSSWESAPAGSFAPIAESTPTRFYRLRVPSFSLPSVISHLRVAGFASAGILCYVDGREAFRRNLPSGPLSPDQSASSVASSPLLYHSAVMLTESPSLIACEVHERAFHPAHNDTFFGVAYFLTANSRGESKLTEWTLTYSRGEAPMDSVCDDDDRTSFALETASWLQFAVPRESEEHVTQYSITVPRGSQWAPTAWQLEGSKNGQNWIVLDVRENPGYFRTRRKETFLLPLQQEAFGFYRFSFLKSRESHAFPLGEISLQSVFLETETPSLQYDTAECRLFRGESDVSISPIQAGFHSFSREDVSLPAGLSFSSLAGSVFGSISETAVLEAIVMTVSGLSPAGDTQSTALLLRVDECRGDAALLRVRQVCGGKGDGWELRSGGGRVLRYYICDDDDGDNGIVDNDVHKGINDNDTHKGINDNDTHKGINDNDTHKGINDNDTHNTLHTANNPIDPHLATPINTPHASITNAINTVTICLPANDYSLHTFSPHSRGWTHSSLQLDILLPSLTIPLGDATLPAGTTRNTIPLSLQVLSTDSREEWQILTVDPIPANWFQTAAGWTTLPAEPATFPPSVWLLRRQFPAVSSPPFLELELYSRGEVIVILNGRELHRGNLPPGTPQTDWTAGESVPRWLHLQLPAGELANTNTLAIAVVNPAGNFPLDFRCFALLTSNRGEMSRLASRGNAADSFHGSDNGHIAGFDAMKLLDGLRDTEFRGSAIPAEVTIWRETNRLDVVDTYCLLASSSPRDSWEPLSWEFRGSADGNNWLLLHSVSHVRIPRGEERCFAIPSSQLSRHQLRITAGIPWLAEWRLLFRGNSVPSQPFHVVDETVTAFVDIPAEVSFLSGVEPFQDFSVEPSLPAGLFIDAKTGTLFGTPQETAELAVYSVTGVSSGGSTTVIVRISVVSCSGRFMRVSLQLPLLAGNELCEIVLQREESPRGNALFARSLEAPSPAENITLCIPAEHYSLHLLPSPAVNTTFSYSVQESWREIPLGGKVVLKLLSDTLITRFASWRFIVDETPPADWNRIAVADWASASAEEIPAGTVLFACTSFHGIYSAEFSGFTAGMVSTGGMVMYLNGVELFRANLPAGIVDLSTLPLTEFVEAKKVSFSGSVQFRPFSVDETKRLPNVPAGHNNLFCIEDHHRGRPAVNHFACTLSLIPAGSNRILEGIPTGSVEGAGSPWFETVDKAFDGDEKTKFYGSNDGRGFFAQWSYVDRVEFVNYLRFSAGNSPLRRPLSLQLSGSLDGTKWTPIFGIANLQWSSAGNFGESKEWSFNNTAEYAMYRLTGDGCEGSQGIEFAEIRLESRRAIVDCPAEDGFPAATEGAASEGPCPAFFAGVAKRLCRNGRFTDKDVSNCVPIAPTPWRYTPEIAAVFTHESVTFSPVFAFVVDSFSIRPSLPAGIRINVTSGVIQGIPAVETPLTIFTVTARNSRGSAATTIQLTVSGGCPDISDFPATPVGESATRACGRGKLGSVTRRCEKVDGVATWGSPRESCTSVAVVVLAMAMVALVLATVLVTWVVSERLNEQVKVFEGENGEYEMEEVNGDGTRVRVRPQMKLVGRPVFIYLPRYFKKKSHRKEAYHRIQRAPQRNRVSCVCFQRGKHRRAFAGKRGVTPILRSTSMLRGPRQQATGGFLCSFIEERVDYPPSRFNGRCVIHYKCQSMVYEMHVNLVNGKREGEAIIYRESEPYITMTYFHGQLTGSVTRTDELDHVNLRGYLINGVESGLFHIFYSAVPTRAYFRNGKPYSVLIPCYRKAGYYEERSVDTGEVLSVAEYDQSMHDKNGMCFEYKDGQVVSQWYCENGMRVRPIKEYENGALRMYTPSGMLSKVRKCEFSSENIMMENRLWKNGMNLRELLSSILREDKGMSLLTYDIKKRCDFGVLQDASFYYQVKWSPTEYHLVAADMSTRKIRVYDELKTSSFYDEGKIALNSRGKRWEGGVVKNRPFGYGVVYNEEGQKEYEGFMVEKKKAIYGTEYFSDIEKVKYSGFFCDDKRCGKGVSYDRSGNVEYEGFWRNDKPYSSEFDGKTLDNRLETVEIPKQALKTAGTLVFPLWLQSLKHIETGKLCCDDVRFIEIDGLEKLESVVIGERSFTTNKEWYNNWVRWTSDGLCRIVNCPNLHTVEIGEFSFSDFNFLELKNLPSLEVVAMGKKCFRFGVVLSLVELPVLQSVSLGDCAFEFCHLARFENLPALRSIALGVNAIYGDNRGDRTMTLDPPHNFLNALIMKNLPALTSFRSEESSFACMGSVVLQNVPRLLISGIRFVDSFCFTYSLVFKNAGDLPAYIKSVNEYL